VAKVAGLPQQHTTTLRLFGAREIAAGVGIFMQQKPAASLWSRVVGDGLDLACLGAAFASPQAKKGRLAFATASVLGVTALDVFTAQQFTNGNGAGVHVHRSLVINRSREDVYDFWRQFENLPRFMKHLKSVTVVDQRRSHWAVTGPAGATIEWDAEITEDRPNDFIAWRSLEGADVDNRGSIQFINAPGERGTIIHVNLHYEPPGGALGAAIATLFGEEPGQQLASDLRRFKQLMETGEVVVSDATVRGTGYTEQQPAQPPADATEFFEDNILDL
jgi:uncharacterized membrane protein